LRNKTNGDRVQVQEQMYSNFSKMILQIVLVIVSAVQVNSHQLCPSVCQCYSEKTICTNLFSDVTNMTQETFHSALRKLRVSGSTRLETEEDLFRRWNITSLIFLYLLRNNIAKIWQPPFYSLANLVKMDLSENRIKTLNTQTFYYNTHLVWLDLHKNRITELHPLTFQSNIKLKVINISNNRITSLYPDLFKNNVGL
jgi:Leucine-rich repeat (LRR) protein